MRRWYQNRWWYIERPFPWPLFLVLVLAAVGVGAIVYWAVGSL